jgi:hypothetical protein
MRLPTHGDTALTHDVRPHRSSNDPAGSSQDHRHATPRSDVGESREVDEAELVGMLQEVMARKLREFGE